MIKVAQVNILALLSCGWGSFYSFTVLFNAGVKLLFFVFAAKQLGPLMYANWPLVLAVMSYSMFIGFGVETSLGRELTICQGAKKHFRYLLLLGNSFKFLLCFWLVLTLLALVLLFTLTSGYYYSVGVLFAVVQNIIQFFSKIHRSKLNFKTLAISQGVSALCLLISLLFMWRFSTFLMLMILFFISLIVQLMIVIDIQDIRSSLSLGQRFFSRSIIYLLKIGIPLMTSGIIFTLLFSVDRWLVKYYFSDIILGQYSLAVFTSMGIQSLITSIGLVYYPSIAYGFGANNNISAQRKNIFLFLIQALVLIVLLIVSIWFLMPSIVVWLLPEYLDGINAAKMMVLGGIALPFATVCSMLLRVKKFLWPLVLGQSVGILLSVCIILYGCSYGKLEFVGISVAISYVVYSLCVICISVFCFIILPIFNRSGAHCEIN